MGKAELEILGLTVPTPLLHVYHDDGFVDSVVEHVKKLDKKYRIQTLDIVVDNLTKLYRKYIPEPITLERLERETQGKINDFRIRESDNVAGSEWRGLYVKFVDLLKVHHYIFYRKDNFLPIEVRVRAHEETHVLEYFKGLDLLSDKILKEQNVKINFRQIDDKEVRADIGSIYALFSRNVHPNIVKDKLLRRGYRDKGFESALSLYEQSRI